jgi:hypothetical protein
MFVDTALLRMGADFSRSAGTIAQRGASAFASVQVSAGIFGDFDTAHELHCALSAAHQVYAKTLAEHHEALEGLAEKASVAATTFTERDRQAAEDVTAASNAPPNSP